MGCDTSCLPSPQSLALWYSWKVWCSVRLSLPLIRSHIADSQGACHRRRVERGLKCSIHYSKCCLINNVSERTRWDTAGLLCLSQAHAFEMSDLTSPPCLQDPPTNVLLNIHISKQKKDDEEIDTKLSKHVYIVLLMNSLSCCSPIHARKQELSPLFWDLWRNLWTS